MRRFVILEHDHPKLHLDLMLEAGDVLQTWRLAGAPSPGRSIDATAPSRGGRPCRLSFRRNTDSHHSFQAGRIR